MAVFQVAMTDPLVTIGIKPTAVVGHSAGETDDLWCWSWTKGDFSEGCIRQLQGHENYRVAERRNGCSWMEQSRGIGVHRSRAEGCVGGSPSQNHTHTAAKQHTLEPSPSGTVGDIVQAARGHIPPNLKLSSEDINDVDMQVYAVRQSQHSHLSWF